MERKLISSGSKWEPLVGYSRAVRVGADVYVSGTVGALPDGTVPEGVYAQARRALEVIAAALAEAGASMRDVVRTRMYVTDIAQWQEAGRAHAEFFAEVRPATSMVQVAALIDPAHLIEIEADAVVAGP